MKTLEDLDREYAAKRDEILRRDAILAQLPEGIPTPRWVHFADQAEPWVSYETETLDEALAILDAYGALHLCECRRDGCVTVKPPHLHEPRYAQAKLDWQVDQCVELRQSSGRGFASYEVSVHAVEPAVKVVVNIKSFPWHLRSYISCNYGRDGDPIYNSVKLIEPATFKAQGQQRIKYGAGGQDSLDLRYYFAGIEHLRHAVEATTKREAA